jgi:uncharacterized damage-inducible protein DinB
MNIEEIRRLYAYDRWANGRFVAAAGALGEEKYATYIASSFPSVRDTLAHIVAVEWIWLQRWQGTSPAAPPPWADKPALAELRTRSEEVGAAIERFLSGLSAADLEREVPYHRLTGQALSNTLGDLLFHAVNHASYHRGQLTTLFRQLGSLPPSTDFVLFTREPRDT